MYTSLLTLALTISAAAQSAEPAENKPLAVFLGTGEQGQVQLVREGLSQEASDLLSTQFICVYIDTATPMGKRWASAFKMNSGKGIVLSSRDAVYQAYATETVLSNQDLIRQLQGVTSASRTSYYPATEQQPATGTAPAANYCPSCQGGGRRR